MLVLRIMCYSLAGLSADASADICFRLALNHYPRWVNSQWNCPVKFLTFKCICIFSLQWGGRLLRSMCYIRAIRLHADAGGAVRAGPAAGADIPEKQPRRYTQGRAQTTPTHLVHLYDTGQGTEGKGWGRKRREAFEAGDGKQKLRVNGKWDHSFRVGAPEKCTRFSFFYPRCAPRHRTSLYSMGQPSTSVLTLTKAITWVFLAADGKARATDDTQAGKEPSEVHLL